MPALVVNGGLPSGGKIDFAPAHVPRPPTRRFGGAAAFPAMSADTLVVVDQAALERLGFRAAPSCGPGRPAADRRCLRRRKIRYLKRRDRIIDATSFASVQWTFGYLRALGLTLALIGVGGLLLYLDTRQRERVVARVRPADGPACSGAPRGRCSSRWRSPSSRAICSGPLSPSCAEALIRLRHPAWGIVPPACFLPEKGDPHFRALSDFVILKAMADWTHFAVDYMPIEISVNLPVAVLADPDFVERGCRQSPAHCGVQPARRGDRQQRADRQDRTCAQDHSRAWLRPHRGLDRQSRDRILVAGRP